MNLSTILDTKLWSIPRWLETVFGYRRVVEYLPEFNVLCRFRLGYEIFPQSVRNCPLCDSVNDVHGDHLLCCQQNGISRRHNAIVDYLPVVKAAGLSTEPLTSIVDNDSVSSHRGIDQSLVLRILDRFPPFLMGH